MRRALLVLLCLCIGLPAVIAQEPMLVSVTFLTVKPGMEEAFLALNADHLQWHRDTNDSHYYTTSQAITGSRTGQYAYSIGPMTAAQMNEFDAFLPTDMADVAARGGMEQVASMERIVMQTIPGVGNPPPPGHMAKLVHVWEIQVGDMAGFMSNLRKLDALQHQVGVDGHVAFTTMVSGGHPGTVMMVEWTDGWATDDGERDKMLAEAAGGEEAYGKLMAALIGAVDDAVVTSYQPLPELSFQPSGQ